jgi:small subunit ribosomal protein S8e
LPRSLENLRKRKLTGGRKRASRGRRAYEKDSYPMETSVARTVKAAKRGAGGNLTYGLRSTDVANVSDLSSGTTSKSKIIGVTSNPANREYERRGVITKGATIETELGLARVTSRPGDEGVVNAVLVKSAS